MDYNFSTYIDEIIRIMLACLSGYLIGSERENRRKYAGVTTHTIVALGACLGMLVSKYGFLDVERYDEARVGAQIISGIGFLGAGVIFVKNDRVTGLTTAAGIWTTSIIGMAYGAGMYFIAIVSTITVLILQLFIHGADIIQSNRESYKITIKTKSSSIINEIEDYFEERKIDKPHIDLVYEKDYYILSLKLVIKDDSLKNNFISYLEQLDIEKFQMN